MAFNIAAATKQVAPTEAPTAVEKSPVRPTVEYNPETRCLVYSIPVDEMLDKAVKTKSGGDGVTVEIGVPSFVHTVKEGESEYPLMFSITGRDAWLGIKALGVVKS